jgi:hypothetical protein
MKKNALIPVISALAVLLISVSCAQRQSEADLQENLSDIREEKIEVISQIDEALALADISEFRRKTEDALNKLDNQIDDYHNEMDNADRRIDRETRDAIIAMKQKKTAIEFKLDLLDDRDDRRGLTYGMGTETSRDVSGAERAGEAPRTDRIEDRTGPDRTGQMTGPDRTGDRTGGPEGTGETRDVPPRTGTGVMSPGVTGDMEYD